MNDTTIRNGVAILCGAVGMACLAMAGMMVLSSGYFAFVPAIIGAAGLIGYLTLSDHLRDL